MMQLTKKLLPLLLKSATSQIVICSSSLCVEPRETYGLQGASKVAYKYFIDALRKGKKTIFSTVTHCLEHGDKIRIMTVLPGSLQTNIFAKGGDMRDTSGYARPEQVADVMMFMLNLPENLLIRDIVVENKRS
jgi:NADP-dependent 3-hydroxy acid dehydrogenase YdfG